MAASFPEKQGNAVLGKIADPEGRDLPSGQKIFRLQVVKCEILREGGGGFVGGFQESNWARYGEGR